MAEEVLQFGSRTSLPSGDEEEGDDFPLCRVACLEVVEGLDEEVYALIAVLIAPPQRDEEGLLRVNGPSIEAGSHLSEEATHLTALRLHRGGEGRASDVEAIGQDYWFTPEELLSLPSSELADGSEDRRFVCSELLHSVLSLNT